MRGVVVWYVGLPLAVFFFCTVVLAGCQQADLPSREPSRPFSSVSVSQPSSSSSSSSQSSRSSLASHSSHSSQTSQSSQSASSSQEEPVSEEHPLSAEPQGGTDVPSTPESAPSLWELADVIMEKGIYGAEASQVYFRLYNKSEEAMYIMRDYEVERLENGQWVSLGTCRLESQSIQYAIEPGTSRLAGIPVDWLKEPNDRYGDERIPAGSYRLRVYINQHFWRTVPFAVQEDPVEEDTTFYEIRTVKKVYLTISESVDYEVVNKTDQELSFSYRCFLERWDGEVWRRYQGIGGPNFNIIAGPNGVVMESFPLEPFRTPSDPLEPGEYRLVKTLARGTFYAPFTLVESLEVPVPGEEASSRVQDEQESEKAPEDLPEPDSSSSDEAEKTAPETSSAAD